MLELPCLNDGVCDLAFIIVLGEGWQYLHASFQS